MPPSETKQQLEETKKQLDRIENAIIGNDHEGLLARTARIETRLDRLSQDTCEAKDAAKSASNKSDELCSKAIDAVHELTVNLTKLKDQLETHVGTDHLSVLMKKKEFWTLIILGFISLHLLVTYLPNVWDWVMVVVGLPRLIIPLN